jgi:hypothetical protein
MASKTIRPLSSLQMCSESEAQLPTIELIKNDERKKFITHSQKIKLRSLQKAKLEGVN